MANLRMPTSLLPKSPRRKRELALQGLPQIGPLSQPSNKRQKLDDPQDTRPSPAFWDNLSKTANVYLTGYAVKELNRRNSQACQAASTLPRGQGHRPITRYIRKHREEEHRSLKAPERLLADLLHRKLPGRSRCVPEPQRLGQRAERVVPSVRPMRERDWQDSNSLIRSIKEGFGTLSRIALWTLGVLQRHAG